MKSKSFEEKLESSKEILERLMSPDITLEESIKLYEEGMHLIYDAQKMIEKAKLKIEKIESRYQEQEQ